MPEARQDRNLPTKHEADFAQYLVGLLGARGNTSTAKPDRAALAALRRGLGKTPGEAPEMFPYIIPRCSGLGEFRQNDFFLVAALFASHQGIAAPFPAVTDARRNSLGGSFRLLAERTNSGSIEKHSGSIEKRFIALLDASRDELAEHLRHSASLLKAHSVGIDWAQLLHDLNGWDWPSRSVQRRWAYGYWYTSAPPEESNVRPEASATPNSQ